MYKVQTQNLHFQFSSIMRESTWKTMSLLLGLLIVGQSHKRKGTVMGQHHYYLVPARRLWRILQMLWSARKCFQSTADVHITRYVRHMAQIGRNTLSSLTSRRSLKSDALSSAVLYCHCSVQKKCKPVTYDVDVSGCASWS